MSQYWVELTGHIDERKRPENFPKTVKFVTQVEASSNAMLVDEVSKALFVNFLRLGGVATRLDPHGMETLGETDVTQYTFTPVHMITHITPVVKLISDPSIAIFGEDKTDEKELPPSSTPDKWAN